MTLILLCHSWFDLLENKSSDSVEQIGSSWRKSPAKMMIEYPPNDFVLFPTCVSCLLSFLKILLLMNDTSSITRCLTFSKIFTLVYTIRPIVQTVWADIAFVFLFRPIGESSRISATFPQSCRNLVGPCVGDATNLRVETPRLGRGRTRDGGNNSVKVICSCCRQGPKARQSWGSHGQVNICEPDKSINCGSTVFGAPHPLAPTADKNAKLTSMPSRPMPRHIPLPL